MIANHELCNKGAEHSFVNIGIVTVGIRCTRFSDLRLRRTCVCQCIIRGECISSLRRSVVVSGAIVDYFGYFELEN